MNTILLHTLIASVLDIQFSAKQAQCSTEACGWTSMAEPHSGGDDTTLQHRNHPPAAPQLACSATN